MAVTSSLRANASVPPRRSDRAHAGRARKWFVTLFAPDNKKRERVFFWRTESRFGHFRRRVNDVDAWPARGCPHAGADPRRTGQALGEEVSHPPYNPDRTNPGHPRARRPTHKSKTRVPEISSHRDPSPPTPPPIACLAGGPRRTGRTRAACTSGCPRRVTWNPHRANGRRNSRLFPSVRSPWRCRPKRRSPRLSSVVTERAMRRLMRDENGRELDLVRTAVVAANGM